MSQNKLLALLLDDYLKEEACMKYINAKDILPNALVKELQNYIQGGYIYVPTKKYLLFCRTTAKEKKPSYSRHISTRL